MLSELQNLLELQKIDREILRLNDEVAALPKKVAAIEQKLAGTKAVLEKAKTAVKADDAHDSSFILDFSDCNLQRDTGRESKVSSQPH